MKQFFLDLGEGFVDGVTYNLTNSTTSVCKDEFQHIGHIVDDARVLFGDLTVPNVLGFFQNVTSTWLNIASGCQFQNLVWNIMHSGNLFIIIPRIFKILIFKIPSLVKAEWTFFSGLFTWNAYKMGFGLGKNISVVFDWEIR